MRREWNIFQECVLDHFDNGAFKDFVDIEHVESDGGDALLLFLLRELASSEDCDSWDEAYRRVARAVADCNAVLAGFERDADQRDTVNEEDSV